MEKKEVSNLASDTYYFYINLGKQTRQEADNYQKDLENCVKTIKDLTERLEKAKQEKTDLERLIEQSKLKDVEIQKVVGELEKQKVQFRTLVTSVGK